MHSRTKQSNRSRQNNYRCLNNTPDGIWASQLISRLFQGTSMLAHYCNNWKPAAEACLSDYPGSRLHAAAKSKKNTVSRCLLLWQVQGPIVLRVRKCLKEAITNSHNYQSFHEEVVLGQLIWPKVWVFRKCIFFCINTLYWNQNFYTSDQLKIKLVPVFISPCANLFY